MAKSVLNSANRPLMLMLYCNISQNVNGPLLRAGEQGYHQDVSRGRKKRGCDMIEVLSAPDGSGTQLRLRPPRALDARQFVLLFVVLAGAMWLVASLGWFAGNVLAPLFALLYSLLLAVALRSVWRSGERQEEIRVVPACVEVIPAPGQAPVFSAHPYWVRLIADEESVRLVSSGRQVQVGAFLAPVERQALALKLEGLLAASDGCNRRR